MYNPSLRGQFKSSVPVVPEQRAKVRFVPFRRQSITLILGDSTMKFDEIRQIFWFVLLMLDRAVSCQLDQVLKLGGWVDNNQYISWMAASGVLCGRGSDAVCVLLAVGPTTRVE